MQGDKISGKPIDKPKTSIFQLAKEKACTILDTAFSFKLQFLQKIKRGTQYTNSQIETVQINVYNSAHFV